MAEINGYFLTKEEEKACEDLVKKMRERKVFEIDFTGCIKVKAKNPEEANEIFWKWVDDVQDYCSSNTIVQYSYFENDGVEED